MAKKLIKKPIKKQIKKSSPLEEREKIRRIKIKIVGIGGGGGNIVSELSQRVKKAGFLVANTDLQALKQVPRKIEHFLFGQSFTRGLGTGMEPELAEMAAQNEKEKIKKIFQGQDLIIFVACLGGGTGSGASSVFAKLAKNQNVFTYGIFTLPFDFEGERKMEIARLAIEKIRPNLNAITVIPNENVFQSVNKNTPLKDAFSTINRMLSESLEGLIETIYQPGIINIDFADLKTILEGQGKWAYLNTIYLPRKENTVEESVKKVLNSSLYPFGIKGAKGVLFNISGENNLSLEEVNKISRMISEEANPDAKIIFGISSLHNPKDVIKTTVFATGCQVKIFPDKKQRPQRKINPKKQLFKKTSEKTAAKTNQNISSSVKKEKPKEEEPKKAESNKENYSPDNLGKKVKIEVRKEDSKEPKEKIGQSKNQKNNLNDFKTERKQFIKNELSKGIRKNALQIKKEIEEEEEKIIEKEKFWEIPTFLRKKTSG